MRNCEKSKPRDRGIGAFDSRVIEGSEARRSIPHSAGIVSLGVVGSSLVGLLRELVFATFFGVGSATDAFIIAFRIPSILRGLFAEGALSAAFVTTFSQYLSSRGEREAWRLVNLVTNGLIVTLVAVVAAGMIFAPQIVALLVDTSGVAQDVTRATLTVRLAVKMTRIMFPCLLMISLAAVAMSVLNSKGRFGIPSSAPALFNAGSMFGGLVCAYLLAPGYIKSVLSAFIQRQTPRLDETGAADAIIGMAVGTLLGGMLQWLIQVPGLRAVGYRWKPVLNFRDTGVRQVMRLMAPAVIGIVAAQVNVLVNTRLATGLGVGPVSWLNYAFRLTHLPVGLFGVAIATAMLPIASRAAVSGRLDDFRHTIASSLRLNFLLTVPSAVGLFVLSRPIIALVYRHGRFTVFDTEQAALAVQYFAIGLTAQSANRVMVPAFYALNETRIPMVTSICSVLVNYVVASVTIRTFGLGHRGLALAMSSVAVFNFMALLVFLRRRIGGIEGRSLAMTLGKATVASFVMGAMCWLVSGKTESWFGTRLLPARIADLLISIVAGVVVFCFAARLLKVHELSKASELMRARFARWGAGELKR